MAFEVACGQCQGRLMVEQAGVVVACPHCGAHLTAEAPPEAVSPSQEVDTNTQVDEAVGGEAADSSEQQQPVDQSDNIDVTGNTTDQPVEPVPQEGASPYMEPTAEPGPTGEAALNTEQAVDAPGVIDTPQGTEEPAAFSGFPAMEQPQVANDLPLDPTDTVPEMPAVSPDFQNEVATVGDTSSVVTASPEEEQSQESISSQTSVDNVNNVSAAISNVADQRSVSHQTFSLLRSYAIAMTLAVAFLVYKLLNPNMSALESLPDVKPPKKDDKIVYKLVPEATQMPPGHLLSLGQSQRFGNLKVTPVRVTKEPVEFVHHLGDTGVTRAPGSDVVKLWFEFENLSSDQHISPLDGLVFRRDDNDFENVRSNNFVCRQSEKKKGGELVFVYDLNEGDIWNLRDQNIEQEIAPGEKLQTYVPTGEDGVAKLLNSDEPLIWRVQFRKGYSPKNYGVTTVIEVAFETSDIGTASTAPEEPAPETEKDSAA